VVVDAENLLRTEDVQVEREDVVDRLGMRSTPKDQDSSPAERCARVLSLDQSRSGSRSAGRALCGLVWVRNESTDHGEDIANLKKMAVA